jgi:hypothetical protein
VIIAPEAAVVLGAAALQTRGDPALVGHLPRGAP